MEQRIIELEKKITFQDRAIEELNEVLIDQQKKIDELETQLRQFKEQLSSENLIKKSEDEERPPHY